MNKKKVLVILGSTSTGKTDLAIKLTQKFSGEIISADSRQVYTGLDIGTGKVSGIKYQVSSIKKKEGSWEMDGVKIWMFDVADPEIRFDVKNYRELALLKIEEIFFREKLPIITGGSGLYIRALFEDLSDFDVSVDLEFRKSLEKLSLFDLQLKLKSLSMEVWESLNNSEGNNPRRLVRHIEKISSGKSQVASGKSQEFLKNWEVLKVGLRAERDVINKRIDERVDLRIEQGMIEEAWNLFKNGLSLERMKELGLEYGMLADYIGGKISKEKLAEILKVKIHQYAKRQMTWFKKDKEVVWFDITQEDYRGKVEKMVDSWYNLV